MKNNLDPIIFGVIAASVSAGLCFTVSLIRTYRDRKRRSAINAANGFDYQSTEKPFVNEICNN